MTKLLAIVAARNEADRIGASVDGLRAAFPGVEVWVGDDASGDGTAEVALAHGARVVSRGRPHGKGGNVTAAAEAALDGDGHPDLLLVCDGDLGAGCGSWSRRSRPAAATSRSPPSATGSGAASGSPCASPAGRFTAAAATGPAPRSPGSGRCAAR